MNLRQELEQRVSQAMVAAGAPVESAAMVAASANPKFGDYQANGVMAAAKRLGVNPRELAVKVVAELSSGGAVDLSDLAGKIEIAGPGFINISISGELLAREINQAAGDERLDVAAQSARTVVIDYSQPNVAKEMHVGHLRSTIIGDAVANVLEFLGYRVVRQNHIGDWGTQFGMLIGYLKRTVSDWSHMEISDLEDFYRKSKQLFDADAEFADQARKEVVALQGGDPESKRVWQRLVDESMRHCNEVYRTLDVGLRPEHVRGESAYNDDLPSVVADLESKGLLTVSDGAKCVFMEQFKGKDGSPLPVIVQKSDGGYLYATTDLAGIRYRANVLHASRILYVVDARQSLHFQQVFAVAKAAGFVDPGVSLEHVPFGTMLGEDGKPFKTRTGGTIKLIELLNEAIERAGNVVVEKVRDLGEEERREIARAVGIGAVKYADLSMDRTSDYKFSWDKMLNMQGNTAPYMQYAYARVRSIFRKGAQEAGDVQHAQIVLNEAQEIELAKKILRLEEVLLAVAAEAKPNLLTAYLYDLSGAFSAFYENCPVLKSEEPMRSSRLRLCDVTARTIQKGLNLLGIATIEQM